MPPRLQQSSASAERALADGIDNQVVSLVVRGEIIGHIVDDSVGAQVRDEGDMLRATDCGHIETHAPRDLDRGGADRSALLPFRRRLLEPSGSQRSPA